MAWLADAANRFAASNLPSDNDAAEWFEHAADAIRGGDHEDGP